MSRLPLDLIQQRYADLNALMATTSDTQKLIGYSKEHKKVQPQFDLAQQILELERFIQESKDLLVEIGDSDAELAEMTRMDIEKNQLQLQSKEEELLSYLAPEDERDDYNIVLEMRAGAGGDESSIFVGDLHRMYDYLAQQLGLQSKIIAASTNPVGGFKELILEIRGDLAYSWFKYEGGVHRVQRVPATEKQGRIHTSTVSVAVMPLIENDTDFKLDMSEVEVIASTSQGAGGQSVNTTYSAIKVKHLPTGIEAQSQDERNQIQNKIKALQVLTSRVFDHFEQERLAKERAERKEQVGTADRSEKIRTYNYPQDRVTDHRYNITKNNLPSIMDGGVREIIEEIKRIEAERVLDSINQK